MIKLGVNIDHVATVREARKSINPDPIHAAVLAELGGCDGITVHLREDRRHINDRDVYLLRKTIKTKLNLEMSINKEIVDIALDVIPDNVTLVPEKREELTTEGGLDVEKYFDQIKLLVNKFHDKNITVSLFIDPDKKQIELSKKTGSDMIEIHTGKYCNLTLKNEIQDEINNISSCLNYAVGLGLIVNMGHGLDYKNILPILKMKKINEFNIGHSIISRAVFVGLERAVKEMKELLDKVIC